MNPIAETETATGTAGSWRLETRPLVALALPLIFTELSYMTIFTTDVIMIGWLGADSLAAGSLAAHFYAFFDYFALGVVSAVAPMLAQHLGARRFRMVRRTVRQGFWASIMLAIPCVAVIWHTDPILRLLGQDAGVAAAGQAYLRIMVIGFLPGLWYLVLTELLAAHYRPTVALVIAVLAIGVNALADYAFIFGHFGAPRLELRGAGIASALTSCLMFVSLLVFVLADRRLRRYRLTGRFWRADWPQFLEIFRVGVPIAVAHLAEMGMFLATALVMGAIGTTTLAAHAIAIQCISISYMIPAGIGQAATMRVGRAIGAKRAADATRAGWTAIGMGAVLSMIPACAFWFFGDGIAALFLDSEVPENVPAISLAVSFLAIAALFQMVESVQVTALGSLRGMKDTRLPMLFAVGGYWGIGLGLALLFGVYLNYGGQAVWIGLALALSAVSVLLLWRFSNRTRLLRATSD